MVDFSCALKLAMPLAVLSAMREASAFHITVKGGKYLEKTALADTVVFDKAGTLTHACPVVAEVIPFGRQDETEMLRLAVCLNGGCISPKNFDRTFFKREVIDNLL